MRWIKYGTQSDVRFTLVKRGVVDLAVTGDYTPAAADSAISKDGGNYADTTNTIAVIGGTPTRGVVGWKLTISATEAQAAELNIQIVDAATKAVEDQFLTVYTYGNASAKFAGDWSDIVRLGLTALPNVASGSAGAIPTTGTGANQINVTGGRADADVLRWNTTAVATPATAGIPEVNVKNINNVATTPVTTVKAVIGLTTADVVASVTGAVGSVTGAVGSVTGAVGSVTGNVGGSVASVTARVTANTDQIAGGTVNALIAGRVDANAQVVGTGAIVAGSFAANAIVDAGVNLTKLNNLPEGIKKNTALSAFEFFMADSADHVTGKTGLTVAGAVSIDGGAFGALTNTPATEVANGIYKIDLAAADLNGTTITLKFTSAGADATLISLKTSL